MMTPVISVIMPVHNVVEFIHSAVESILKQSFSDFEFIIIDDASEDDTKKVLDGISDPRIVRINNEKHTGNYKCRNQGLQIAKGKYIAVMDGDDIARPDKLSIQYTFMESNPDYMAVGSDVEYFRSPSQFSLSQHLRDSNKIKVRLLQDNVCSHPTLMIRREVLDFYKIRYNEDYYYAADYDLLLQISQIGKITNLPEPLLLYRIHQAQITSSKRTEQILYADYIRLKQLALLKLRPSVEEIMIHLSLMKNLPVPVLKLELAEKWCNKLISKNHQLNIYNEQCLYRFLEERLKDALFKSEILS